MSAPPRTLNGVPRSFADETPLGLTRRARRINRVLAETYPDAHCELDFTTLLELTCIILCLIPLQSTLVLSKK